MKTMRHLRVFLVTLISLVNLTYIATGASAQAGRLQRPFSKPFVDFRAPLPREITARKLRQTRAVTTPQTQDLTPNTPLVNDVAPFIPKSQNPQNEQQVVFESNRANLAGTQAGTLAHIYRMEPDGSNVVALTGPLSASKYGEATSQGEPALNPTASSVVFVEREGGVPTDIVEMNVVTGQTKSLIKPNVDFDFTAVATPEYGVVPGGNIGIIFAGKASLNKRTNQPVPGGFHIFAVDNQSGRVVQLTGGNCDDRNPTLSPDPLKPVIAFDSDRADPNGNGTKQNRDIWVIDPNKPLTDAQQVTSFSANGTPANNIQPSWSTNRVDNPVGGSSIVRGQQLLAFATNRRDSQNNGNADSINPNGSHDLYWLKVEVVRNPSDPTRFTVTSPPVAGGSGTIPAESANNVAQKLNTSDPNHTYNDLYPAWPQFVTSYRVTYQSDRTFHNPAANDSGPAGQPNDIFSSTLVDINAPTLVRFNSQTGDVLDIQPRISSPGSPVTIQVKVADLESGIRDVWVQIKNPNSKYQGADGLEHKVYRFPGGITPDNTNSIITPPVEYESEPIFIGNNPNDPRFNTYLRPSPPPSGPGVNRARPPVYIAGVDDEFAFSGLSNDPVRRVPNDPTTDTGWLQLQPVPNSRDAEGVVTYSATWVTPPSPSDYYVDVIVYDQALNPFTQGGIDRGVNWKIYDNVWGFSTATFNPQSNILFVSDYAMGQKFFNTRFGVNSPVNALNTFWGTESWMTDIEVSLHPNQYINNTTIGTVIWDNRNTLGVDSYADGRNIDGSVVDGFPLPATQRYDLWRVICRGPVPDAVLSQYAPFTESQPADIGGTPLTVLVAPRCVIWHSPFTGSMFTGPGSLTDLTVQNQLAAFVQAGGRLFVNGQDVAWALTLDGSFQNPFVANVLKSQFVVDAIPNGLFRLGSGALPFPLWIGTVDNHYQLGGQGAPNPISHDPWHGPKQIAQPDHRYLDWASPRNYHPPNVNDLHFSAGGNNQLHNYDSPAAIWPDHVNPASSTNDFNFAAGGGAAAMVHWAGPRERVVYGSMGLEGLSHAAMGVAGAQNTIGIENVRSQVMHSIVCWLRTGTITGRVLDSEGARGIGGVLVRLGNTFGNNGQLVVRYTGLTRDDGTFSINGVEPDIWEVSAAKPGFIIQRRTFAITHGGYRDTISFFMTKAEPATFTGKITKQDGTPVPNATVTATSNDPNNPITLTGTSDVEGNYRIERVPSGASYTLTVTGFPPGFGPPSEPPQIIAPDRDDPTVLTQPATVYTGFDFVLKPIPGKVRGQVFDLDTNQAIPQASVTATQGQNQITVIADANGVYEFPALDPGAVSIVAVAPGYGQSQPVTVTVLSNQTIDQNTNPELRIGLRRVAPGRIRGLITSTADGLPVQGVTVRLIDPAQNTVATTTTGPVQTDQATQQQYNFEFADVPAGVAYTVVPTLTGYTAIPLTRTTPVIQSGVTAGGINFQLEPLHTFPGALTLVSTPFDYPNADAAALLNIDAADRANPNVFKFATWQLGQYIYYPNPPANTFRIGRGYFLGYKRNMPFATEGTPADPNRPFDIPLDPGWNLIGDPFLFEIDWTKVKVVHNNVVLSHDQAVTQGLISNALYGFVAGQYALDFRLTPWKGHWVRAFSNVILRIDPTTDRLGRAAFGTGSSRAALLSADGWSVNLQLKVGSLVDGDNHIGVSSRAADGYDRYKTPKPPIFGDEYAYLSFDHDNWADKSGSYGVDIRSAGVAPKTWEFTVQTSEPNAQAALAWPNAAAADRNVNLTLTDLATGLTRDMRTNGSYTWRTGDGPSTRRFKIEARPADRSSRLVVSGIAGRTLGRGTGLGISYNLSAAANVEIRILGASGNVVRSLAGRATRAAGVNQATWDAKNDRGVAVPAGAYIIEIRAQTPDGSQSVRAAQPVLLTR